MREFETNAWKIDNQALGRSTLRERARVLVVDDSEISRELVREALDEERYEVLEASNGHEALCLLERGTVDLILLDIQMPLLDGYETIGSIRRNPSSRSIPVVALTAYAMMEDREKALAAGFDDYIAKPLKISSLCQHVDQLLNQRPE